MSTHAWTESRVRDLHDDLVSLYEPVDRVAEHGADPTAEPGEGVRQLVTTILSQNVADANTSRATTALFDRYDDFAAIEAADHEELKETIRVGARRPEGCPDPTRVGRDPRGDGRGVRWRWRSSTRWRPTTRKKVADGDQRRGPKTASVVLNFHFGKPTMAVDTHVERVSKRFGLVPESASNQAAHDALDKLVPDELIYPLHVLLIRHGRERCSARGADCDNPCASATATASSARKHEPL